ISRFQYNLVILSGRSHFSLASLLTGRQKKPCYDEVIDNNALISTWRAWIKLQLELRLTA
ncbi:MAG: hypothetical protein Q8K59_01145, partial [Nitrosomonas sp.]|nr:hypothetical protein [Nitrosomonas sp.]